jgi:hypothetical protein
MRMKSLSRRFVSRGVLLTSLTLAAPLLAPQSAGGRFEVELIVFRSGTAPGMRDLAIAPSGSITGQPITTRRLADAAARIRANSGYRMIAHTAWSQPAASWNSRRGVAASQVGLGSAGFSGTVFVERGQFLHLGFDLRLTDGDETWSFKEVRRVKSGERHYFDHPALGIIALVTQTGSTSP